MAINYFKVLGAPSIDSQFFNPEVKNGKPLFPSTVGIIGPTGSGKSNVLANLIFNNDKNKPSTYTDVAVFKGNSSHDIIYDLLSERLNNAFQLYDLDSLADWIDERKEEAPDDLGQTLCVIDDWIGGKASDFLIKLSTYSRKLLVSLVLISQSYVDIPKLMRKQIKYLILMPGLSAIDLRTIHGNLPNTDVTLDKFKKMYLDSTKEHGISNFMLLDLSIDGTTHKKIFRKGFDKKYNYSTD